MPFFTPDQDAAELRMPAGVEPPNPDVPAIQDVVGAAFRQDNTVVSYARKLLEEQFPEEPGHNPLDVIRGTKYEENHLDNFLGSRSTGETKAIMRRIDREDEDRKTLAASGPAGFVASNAAGLLDPIIALPAGEIIQGARTARTVAKSALSVGRATAMQTTAQEAILHGTHETRTLGESAAAVGSATLLGAFLGGGLRMLSKGERAHLERALDTERQNIDVHAGATAEPTFTPDAEWKVVPKDAVLPAGAEIRMDFDSGQTMARFAPIEDDGVVPFARAAGAGATDERTLQMKRTGLEFSDRVSPTRRTMAAESINARRTMADLAEMPYRFEDSEKGIATTSGGGPALDRIARNQINGTKIAVSDEMQRLYSEYRFGGQKFAPALRGTVERMLGQETGLMTYTEFKQQVALAMQEGDRHATHQVASAAQFIRAKVFDPWKKRAIEAGLLSPETGTRTAESYFQRVYNKQAIVARRPEFVDKVTDWLRSDQADKRAAKERLTSLNDRLRTLGAMVGRFEAQIERLQARQAEIGARLDERAMEVKRTGNRAGGLEERAFLIEQEATDIENFIASVKEDLTDPAMLARLNELEAEARALRKADKPMTEAQLARIEDEELKGILTGPVRAAAEILVGKRKPVKVPSFVTWLVTNGGLKDVGGDVGAIVGGTRVRPGLINNEKGMSLDLLAQKIKEEAPHAFPDRDVTGHGLPEHSEILNWIDDALRGREPDWWVESFIRDKPEKYQAMQMAYALERVFSEADIEVKSIRDVAKVLRDDGTSPVGLAGLEKIAAEMEAAGEAIPPSVKAAAKEDQVFATRETFAELRGLLQQAQAGKAAREKRLRIAEERGDEARIAENANRGRFGVLSDRMARAEGRRDLLTDALEMANKLRDETRAKIETEIGAWEGSSSKEAKSAIKAREKYAEDAGRGEDEPRLEGADRAVDRTVKRILESDRDLDDEALRDRAHDITDRILGSPDGRLPYDIHTGGPEIGWRAAGSPPRGPLAPRDFAIPDATIREFMEQDAEKVVGLHLRTIVPDVLLTERFGDVRMTEAFQKINDEYAARSDVAKSGKERVAIEKERNAVIRDIAGVRDRVRGVYGWSPELQNMARIANGAKAVNNFTSMGSSAISSLQDFAGAIFRFGLGSTLRDGWLPFFRHLSGASPEFDKFKSQMRALGIGIETATNARQHALDDVLDVYQPQSRFERALQATSDKFFVANLLAPLTDMQKTIAAHVAVSEILKATKAVAEGKATKRQIGNLAEGGIDPLMAGRIWEQFQTGGEVVDGVHLPNTADWTARDAARALEGAVSREVDIAVVTPGQEKPLWMSHPVMSILGQFRAFTASSTERIVIANLQRRDANALQGLVASVALGMLSYKVNSLFSGQKTSDRPQDWIKEGISRSGVTGWFEEGNALASKMTRGGVDVYRMIGADKPLSRFASRSTLDMLLGPTAGKIGQLSKVTGASAAGDWQQSDTTALRRLIAFQNLFYVRGLFNEVEEGFNHRFGVETKATH